MTTPALPIYNTNINKYTYKYAHTNEYTHTIKYLCAADNALTLESAASA